MDDNQVTVFAVRLLAAQNKIGIKVGRASARWYELDREGARLLADELMLRVAELDRYNYKPNALGNYQPTGQREQKRKQS